MNKKLIKYIAGNGLFAATIYLGIFKQIGGAENLMLGFAWITSSLSLFILTKPVIDKAVKEGFSVPHAVDALFDLSVVCIFIWFGYFWTAGAYFLHILMITGLRAEVEKKKEENEKADRNQ